MGGEVKWGLCAVITEVAGSAGFGAVEDLSIAVELLNGAVTGRFPTRLYRSYRPARTVAFTMRERHLPGFAAAWEAASASGFTPVLRRTGGRVAAYDHSCLVIDIIEPADNQHAHRDSFGRLAVAIAGTLRGLEVDARIGPVPGEYCPGEFSVGARGLVKLVGIAQRVSRDFRLISCVVAIDPAPHLAQVLALVNAELAFDWNPETCGSVVAENATLRFDTVESALRVAIAPGISSAHLDWGVTRRLHSDLLNGISYNE